MVDVQSMRDDRRVPIQKVGVKGIRYPIVLRDKANEVQHTAAIVNLFADLPHAAKGTHMSRFVEVLDANRHDLSMPKFLKMLEEIRSSLGAETAYADLHFPYFIEKQAPVSGQSSIMSYDCGYSGRVGPASKRSFDVTVAVPVQTVCPCSKAISDYGAHNQRSLVTIRVELKDPVGAAIEWQELVRFAEESASSEIWPMLKRADEKWVTERAYENPKFVEDLVRDVALRLNADARIGHYRVDVENFESIHNHSAWARIER